MEVHHEVDQPTLERVNGSRVIHPQRALVKVLDDNTQQIAQTFRSWLGYLLNLDHKQGGPKAKSFLNPGFTAQEW